MSICETPLSPYQIMHSTFSPGSFERATIARKCAPCGNNLFCSSLESDFDPLNRSGADPELLRDLVKAFSSGLQRSPDTLFRMGLNLRPSDRLAALGLHQRPY